MAHKQHQCEAYHPLHNIRCWLRKHGPEVRHMIVTGVENKKPVREYWGVA